MTRIASRRDAETPQLANPTYPDWQSAMADAVTDLGQLCRLLDIPEHSACNTHGGCREFPLFVPRPYLARIQRGDLHDPLLLQILPSCCEHLHQPGYVTDPVGECQATRGDGVLRKYPGRLLIVATHDCAVHCRFCFRRHFRGRQPVCDGDRWDLALQGIRSDSSIHEVILSGGDPLVLDDAALATMIADLAEIPHLSRVRIHTRLPVVIPQRVSERLLGWMRRTRLTVVVVVHVNHPAEIDDSVAAAFARLVDAGVPLLSQSVLLKGVNDRAEVLAELCERLVSLRVMPYYLHQLDRVVGAAHFEVPEEIGRELLRQLRARLPGYAVPRYVRETAGESSKRVLV
jgi:EF-P beta-lysylation protein EpmB